MRRLLVLAASAFALLATPTSAVTIDWVPIGNAGNAADTPSTNCFAADCGSVAYDYWISKYETTNAIVRSVVILYEELTVPGCLTDVGAEGR